MKTILILLAFFWFYPTRVLYAESWMAETDVATRNAGDGAGTTVYTSEGECKTAEQEPCFDISGKSEAVAYETVQLAREGDWEAAENIETCTTDEGTGLQDCSIDLPGKSCPDGTYTAFAGDLDGNGDLETWCTRKALIKVLKEDAQKKADYEAAQQAASSAEQEKLDALQACRDLDSGAAQTKEIMECLKLLL